ncbi:MATE efflux family protein [Raphanus sativus]|uniref:Protein DETOXIFICATION n=1 Tax=Raphanus sativus TaxID=3726 RepID=A0A6J0KDS4_RAPSA|nr:protein DETOXIFICATION 25 [Raphanus sativus]XP_018446133.2 protein DETOXIFICATION 25 [Raphanus sativus]KAJ4882595.1 MATE efflux family protein [Raphanus sativus]
MSSGVGETEERLLNGSETEQRRESLYLRKKIWSEVGKMWRIALPSTLFRVMSYACIVVAQAFIGHSSETGLAAYALIQSTFIRFIYGVMAGMSSATETLCGQAYGAQQYHMMGVYLQRSWIVDTFTATLFVPLIIYAGPILRLLGQNIEITKTVDEIYPLFIPYLYSIVFTMTMQMYLQAQMKNAIIGVLSTVALVVDIVATWWCVSVMGMGINGALLGLNISSWSMVIGELVYVFGGWCPHTWTGFSTAAFVDLIPMLKLSISSGFMLCLEYWYMSIIVLMSGYTEDANIAISAFSICQYIYTWEMNISFGLLGAACVRVANELGKGDAEAVRFSIKVVLVVSAVIGVLCSVLCLAFGGQISYLFSDSPRVSDAVADLSIVLSISILFNIVQPILSGVAIGAGMQSMVAFVNLATYYGVGIPFGFILINIFSFGVKGLWSGMLTGVGMQTLILSYVIYKTDWEMEVKKTNKRMETWTLKSPSVEPSPIMTRDEERK